MHGLQYQYASTIGRRALTRGKVKASCADPVVDSSLHALTRDQLHYAMRRPVVDSSLHALTSDQLHYVMR